MRAIVKNALKRTIEKFDETFKQLNDGDYFQFDPENNFQYIGKKIKTIRKTSDGWCRIECEGNFNAYIPFEYVELVIE